MELIFAIAMLCQPTHYTYPTEQLGCQRYYVQCYERAKQIDKSFPYPGQPSSLDVKALAQCIKDRKL
jgi:hypothetical protein